MGGAAISFRAMKFDLYLLTMVTAYSSPDLCDVVLYVGDNGRRIPWFSRRLEGQDSKLCRWWP